MSRIYVDFNRLQKIGESCEAVSSKTDGIKRDFQQTIRKLDWDVRFQSDINSTAMQLIRKMQSYHQTLKEYKKFVELAHKKYQELDSVEFELKIEAGRTNIFDGINGYGGDQGDMADNRNGFKFLWWIWGEDKDIYDFIRQQEGYENYSEKQIHELINKINGEGCGYVALVNTIFSEFPGDEQEFEKIFGFPMYDKDGHYNYNLMLADIYCRTDDKYFLTETNGKMAYVTEIANRYRDNSTNTIDMSRMARDYGLPENATEDEIIEAIIANVGGEIADVPSSGTNAYTMENRLRAYFSEKGINSEINCNTLSDMSTDAVRQSIESGNVVDILLTNGAKIYDTNGNQVQVIGEGNHHVIITGVTEDGRYRVSSWGKEYLVDSGSNIGYYVNMDVIYK